VADAVIRLRTKMITAQRWMENLVFRETCYFILGKQFERVVKDFEVFASAITLIAKEKIFSNLPSNIGSALLACYS